MDIPNDVYISAYYGIGICSQCKQEGELRMGWCFECFEKGLDATGKEGECQTTS